MDFTSFFIRRYFRAISFCSLMLFTRRQVCLYLENAVLMLAAYAYIVDCVGVLIDFHVKNAEWRKKYFILPVMLV